MGTVTTGSRPEAPSTSLRPFELEAPPLSYAAEFHSGAKRTIGEGPPKFTLVVRDEAQLDWLFRANAYSTAMAFVRGEFDVRGDLVAAVRFHNERAHPGWVSWAFRTLARYAPGRVETWLQTKSRAARNIRFHYDRSDDFYRQFLDSRLVYSCAYFKDPSWSLDQAQFAKLEHICRKLDLQAGEHFLDIGCGWGALVFHAVERYCAIGTGCTLSRNQFDFAAKQVAERGLEGRAFVYDLDYRELSGQFDKIASVGMFEHVGRHRLREYFQKICSLLKDNGLFLNHGIMRPQGISDSAETLLLQRRVFPGGELAHLSDVIREAENGGFEVLDVENLRPNYALTCREWVERLSRNADQCLRIVDAETYRTWRLYLAASAQCFEDGFTDIYQVLLAKRGCPHTRRLSRDYMYV